MVVQKKIIEKKLEEEPFPFVSQSLQKNKNSSVKNFLIFLFAIFTLLGLAGTYYFFSKYNALRNDPNIVSQKDVDTTVAAVSKLMVLPSEEIPSVATVLDKDKLKDQPFFGGVENGDKLLVFGKAMQAIIYRPSSNKIIKVGPIFINDTTQNELSNNDVTTTEQIVAPQSEEVVASSSLKMAYYNGTAIKNLSAQTEGIVKLNFPSYETVVLSNANKQDYQQSIVVDLSGQHTNEVEELSKLLNAQVQSLPDGEKKPDADILIISGK